MSEHIQARNAIKGLADVQRFDDLLSRCMLSPVDKAILRMHYLEEKDLRFIADFLGYSESTIKKRHVKAIAKLYRLL